MWGGECIFEGLRLLRRTQGPQDTGTAGHSSELATVREVQKQCVRLGRSILRVRVRVRDQFFLLFFRYGVRSRP